MKTTTQPPATESPTQRAMAGRTFAGAEEGEVTPLDLRPAATAQRALGESVRLSPHQVAQRARFRSLFGSVAQLPGDLHPSLVQGVAQLRGVKMGKRKLTNLAAALKDKEFSKAVTAFKEGHPGVKAGHIDFLMSQLFSAEGEDFESLEQFLIELAYDVESKSEKDAPLTLQERYLTEFGWKRAKNKPDQATPVNNPAARLRVFRTMSIDDWRELSKGNYGVLQGAHIGDFKQSLKYFLGESSDTKVMVEFTLKAGAERLLFGKQVGLPKEADRSEKLKTIATVVGGASFPQVSKDQGYSDSAIGLKSESEGEAGFSIAIGGGKTPETFKNLVESIAIRRIGEQFIKVAKKDTTSKELATIETDASQLLEVNNCLINAIANAALGRNATLAELVAIRSVLDNYGEMLLANPDVVQLIKKALRIDNAIAVIYSDGRESEDFDGSGDQLLIYHVNGDHFTHVAPDL